MRMQKDFEAYFDEYDLIKVYMSKNFFNGSSRIFHIKDTKNRIIHLDMIDKIDLSNGYTRYRLRLQKPLIVSEEYTIYDERAQKAIVQYSHIVKTDRFNSEFQYCGNDLGCTYTPNKTTFKVWAPTAFWIDLHLIRNGHYHSIPMHRQEKGVFSLDVSGDLIGAKYTYMVRVNGEWKETCDPYNPFVTENTTRSVVNSIDRLYFPKKIELKPMHSNTEAVIYEASIRDMTSEQGIGVTYPKKFKGFTEENADTKNLNTGFSYLKSLGITHVQLLPVMDFGSVDEVYTQIFYNWGYDPVHHRALEGSYSTNAKDASARIVEFAQLVHDCHKAGIRVNLDLVFNHVYHKESYPLEVLVPNYYFLMNTEGDFSNGSFCGNDVDTQPTMSRKYFLETCKKLIEWFDIDGFRFDLMGILDINFVNEVVKECREIKPDFMIYGEGWNMGSFVHEDLRASMQNQAKMKYVGHFSDRFRETCRGSNGDLEVKGYCSGQTSWIDSMMHCMSASCLEGLFDSPQKAINYVECHDNHTLWDKNTICCQNETEGVLMQRQVLANAMVLLAQGVPFLHAGQEFGRTKYGLGNTYNRSDHYNHIDYNLRNKHMQIVSQTKALIQIRKKHPSFQLATKEEVEALVSYDTVDQAVLVYKTNKDWDRCISFFNPTGNHYVYELAEEAMVLFDNGNINSQFTTKVNIAPYSVVVCQYKPQ